MDTLSISVTICDLSSVLELVIGNALRAWDRHLDIRSGAHMEQTHQCARGLCWKIMAIRWNKCGTCGVVATAHLIYGTCGILWGRRWYSWLRHRARSRKVAGSYPGGVLGIFRWLNPSGRTMTRGSTQPLTEVSDRDISWLGGGGVKAAGA